MMVERRFSLAARYEVAVSESWRLYCARAQVTDCSNSLSGFFQHTDLRIYGVDFLAGSGLLLGALCAGVYTMRGEGERALRRRERFFGAGGHRDVAQSPEQRPHQIQNSWVVLYDEETSRRRLTQRLEVHRHRTSRCCFSGAFPGQRQADREAAPPALLALRGDRAAHPLREALRD